MAAGFENEAIGMDHTKGQPDSERALQNGTFESSAAESPEQEIAKTLREIDAIDQQIFARRKSAEETSARLASLREEIGSPDAEGGAPVLAFRNEQLEKRRGDLMARRNELIGRYGREILPDGVALPDDDDWRRAKGSSLWGEHEDASSEAEGGKERETRKQWFERVKQHAVRSFEKALQEDWRTKGAMNLELAVELMKRQVPEAMDKRAEAFMSGKTDQLPFSTVWIKWQAGSTLQTVLNRPKAIGKLEIMFDDQAEELVGETELGAGGKGGAR